MKNTNNESPYEIVAVPFYGQTPTYENLENKVIEKIAEGYELLGSPFFDEEMTYQAMKKGPHLKDI